MDVLLKLSEKQKAVLFDDFVITIKQGDKNGYGYILGTHQILDLLEEKAVLLGFNKCPVCGRGRNETV